MTQRPSFRTHRLLFGLALGQGVVSILAWVFAGLPLAEGVAWHAHEMIFGQALGVVGGYLLSRLARRPLLLVAFIWLGARAVILAPGVPAEIRAALSILATGAIAIPAALAFLRGAKRAGNLVFPVLLGGFVVADASFQLGLLGMWRWEAEAGVALGLGLVALLIAAMGGRLLSAAASGAAQRAGGARIPPKPGVERALLVLLAAGFAAKASGGGPMPGAVLLAAGGLLLGARLAAWAPGLRRSAGDILALAAGQAWLGLGLIAWALAAAGALPLPERAALHLATIGGIGGTLLVMAMRATAQREGRPMPRRAAPWVACLMGAAAVLRAVASPDWGWPVAALLWIAATLVAAVFVLGPRKP
jgi:uncharacterized protein involved in response to NO